jgi:hypothetical protein
MDLRPTQMATPNVNLRFRTGPGNDQPYLAGQAELPPSSVLAVLSVDGGWAQLLDPNSGHTGYCPADSLAIQPITAYFMPDLYWQDAKGSPHWSTLFLDPRYLGAILKATEGTSAHGCGPSELSWFVNNWPKLASAGGESYGQSWFRGCYHFLDLTVPSGTTPESWGQQQAEFYVSVIQRAGGLTANDLPPIVDVESAGADAPAPAAVVDRVATAWSAAVSTALGRRPMLYRRYNDSDWRGLTSHMGCSYLWAKRYNDALGTLQNGWPSAALWQYTDGKCNVPLALPQTGGTFYPWNAPGICPIDTSVFTCGDGSPAAVRQLITDSIIV